VIIDRGAGRRAWPVLLALGLIAGLAACGSPAADAPAPRAASSARSGFPKTLVDGAGHTLRLAAKPRRIVSQTLGADEILFALVPPERLVGLSTLARDRKYSNVVAEATRHPAPSIESAEDVVRLNPDLVFVASYSRAETVELLAATGAPIYRLANFDDIEGVMGSIRAIGEAVGEQEAAERLVAGMKARLAAVVARRAGHPRPRVLSYSGGFTAGKGTSFDDMLRYAGAINEASARGLTKFPKLGAEQVLAWNPDVLVSGYLPGEQDAVRARLAGGPGLAQTTAARKGQIILIEEPRFLAVSQYMVDAVEQIADGLDAFERAR
jgi:iron complex transport system substrate-binding protein